MGAFITRRLITLVVQMFFVAVLVFLMLRLVPGDPARGILGENATEEQVAAMQHQLGIDRPLIEQFVTWFGGLLTFDLGDSIVSGRDVAGDIVDRIMNSLELIVIAIVLSLIVAIPLGAIAALRANHPTDLALSSFAMLGLSLPSFVTGTVFVLIFGLKLRWIPQSSFISWSEDPVAHMKLLILPGITLGLTNAAVIIRMTRSSTLEVLRQDYIRTARAKGLSQWRVIAGHTLRNAINPVISIVGLQVATLLGGMVIVEQIFNWPGLSSLLLSGVSSRDYPVVQGVVLVIAALTILINVVVDILYAVLDPRIRLS